MKNNLYRIVILLLTIFSIRQSLAQYAWSNLGPDNLGSITRALAFTADGGTLLAGSQGGGLWRSSNLGNSWERVASYDAAGGDPNITSIAVNGNVIFVATGASAFRQPYPITNLNFNPTYNYRAEPSGFKGYIDGQPGGGIFVSLDGGATWSNNNATTKAPFGTGTLNYKGPFSDVQKVSVRGSRVFVATREGLYYSDDNLQTVVLSNGPEFLRTKIVFDIEPAAGDVVLATVHEDGFTARDSLFISRDNGASFTTVRAAALYEGGSFSVSRAELAVAPSDNNIVYLAGTQISQEVSGVFRYNVATDTWSRYAPRGGSAFAPLGSNGRDAMVLAVFPDNPDELILAGNNWYTFSASRGWTQTGTHTNPTARTYIPRSMYAVVFAPNDPKTLVIGTSVGLTLSRDRAASFASRSRGYETTTAYSVSSFGTEINGEEDLTYEVVVSGTSNAGVTYNANYTTSKASKQSFGVISTQRYSEVAASVLHPGVLVAQSADGGLERSLNYGASFERFYGFPITPQVANLTPATTDTIIDRSSDRSAGGDLFNRPNPAQAAWVLDEYVPASSLDNPNLTTEELRAISDSYIFFCSRNYVWLVNNAFGDGLQVKWNRLTRPLVTASDEFLTAITVSGDSNHTVYVGSSKGNLWRLERAHDLANFNAVTSVTQLNTAFANNLFTMQGRWITSLAVDPQNPNRLVVTYGGYGGDLSTVSSFVWITDSARAAVPIFGSFFDSPIRQPVYTAQFVQDPNESVSVLLVGTQHTLYAAKGATQASFGPQFYQANAWVREFEEAAGRIPVFDIYVRRYTNRLNEDALTRKEVRVRTLPNGTVVTDTIELERDNLLISADNTVFVATHGRGIWSTASVARRTGQTGPEIPATPLATDVRLGPNPADAELSIFLDMTGPADVTVSLLSLDGRTLQTEAWSVAEASADPIRLDTWNLPSGIYLVKVQAEGETHSLTRVLKATVVH
ncbi:MAG: T9SS type A sorting domain-containing protein [Bacteroidia bacterium]|nr:T9SS type A sorting domain-containing protein [Bacteroidia bacterium]